MRFGKQTQDGKRDGSVLQQLQDRGSLKRQETLPRHTAVHKQCHAQLSFAEDVDRAEEVSG